MPAKKKTPLKKPAKNRERKKKAVVKPEIQFDHNYLQEQFCQQYAGGAYMGNATRSYLAAGYDCSEESARRSASDLLTIPDIQKRIAALQAERLARLQITGDRILQKVAELAFVNAQDLYDESGAIIPPHKLPRHVASALKEIKMERQSVGEMTVEEFTYKLTDQKSSLELLMKHDGMLTEKHEHEHKGALPVTGISIKVVEPSSK